jgi:hypothetical protein
MDYKDGMPWASSFPSVGRMAIILLPLLVYMMGCKTSDSPTSPPGGSGGGRNFLGAGTPGTPVSDDQRFTAFDTVMQRFKVVSGSDIATANNELAKYLRTMSVFDAAGVSGNGSVWAHFTDDRLLIIANNRPPGEPSAKAFEKKITFPQQKTTEVPFNKNARVLRGLGTGYFDNTPKIKELVTSRGYVISGEDATVDGLEHVNGDGIVYFETHGADGDIMKMVNGKLDSVGSMFSLLTMTPVTRDNDIFYMNDLKSKRLTYFIVKNDTDVTGERVESNHYGITALFVKAYMSFGENSFVFMNACDSYDSDFWQACVANNAGVYVGWTRAIISRDAIHASRFLFSRLLGITDPVIDPEDPPQRPFELELVKTEMSNRNLIQFPDPNNFGGTTNLSFIPSRSTFTLLAPSIDHVDVNESTGQLNLYGHFGTDPGPTNGIVSIDGVAMVYSHWEQSTIVCNIPGTGPCSAGDVIVTVYGHKSNTVQLTEWKGTMTFNQPSVGSLGAFYTFNLHFRGDVHSSRAIPHETPQPLAQTGGAFMSDSKGNFSLGGSGTGTCTFGTCTDDLLETWSPVYNLNLPYVSNGSLPSQGFTGSATILPSTREVQIFISAYAGGSDSSHLTQTFHCGDSTHTAEIDVPLTNRTVAPQGTLITMTMDESFIIQDGSMNVSGIPAGIIPGFCGTQPSPVTNTIRWSNFQAKFLPQSDAAR